MDSRMIHVRRSTTNEISDDLLESVIRKEKKSITLQMSEDMRGQIDSLELAGSEPSSPSTPPSRRGSLASLFSRPSIEIADVSALATDLKASKPRGYFSKKLATAASFGRAK